MPERTGETLERAGTPDSRLADALGHTVETVLKRSVQNEPQLWADAIFPIVLPAIRIAVANALRTMVQTLNQILERSFSVNSWRWRWEAWRTGRSFAEIVLLRTLVYRVEQVLLIDRNSGLLLLSVSAPDVTSQDSGLISAMLSAIQEFIHDSFEVDRSAGIRELHLADFSLWIEQGPRAAIAAAVRGNAPAELRETLRAAIDLVHQECAGELRAFQGDSGPFEHRCRPILEGCLQSRYQAQRQGRPWKAALSLAVAAAIVLALAGLYFFHLRQWNRALAALNQTPGILVSQGHRSIRQSVVEGLRDPLADPPERILAGHGIDPRNVSLRLLPFVSLDPALVLKRAQAYLRPPASVAIRLDREVLTLHGSASHPWILQARQAARPLTLAGIREIRTDELQDLDLDALRRTIEALRIPFPAASAGIGPEQLRLSGQAAAQLRQWFDAAAAIGKSPRVEVVGCGETSGVDPRAAALCRERASRVAAVLAQAAVPPDRLQVVAGGTAHPSGLEPVPPDTVLFRLALGDAVEPRTEVR
jgi:OOP family OmpA-OmpF porin